MDVEIYFDFFFVPHLERVKRLFFFFKHCQLDKDLLIEIQHKTHRK